MFRTVRVYNWSNKINPKERESTTGELENTWFSSLICKNSDDTLIIRNIKDIKDEIPTNYDMTTKLNKE